MNKKKSRKKILKIYMLNDLLLEKFQKQVQKSFSKKFYVEILHNQEKKKRRRDSLIKEPCANRLNVTKKRAFVCVFASVYK